MAKTIVILGASYAGLIVAHKLLKHSLKTAKEELKVVVVSPTTHHYWNLASVRAIIPGQIPDEKVFSSIPDGLAQYKESAVFVLGTATGVDIPSKTVLIKTPSGEQKQAYDILVIATGCRSDDDAPWKSSLSGYEATKAALHKTQEHVKAAKTIVVGGAGPTGVESAAEIGFEYGKNKEVTLITAGSQLLTGVPPSVATFADNELKKLHVNVIKDTKIISSTSTTEGKTELALSNGEKMVVDLYLPTIGVIPNSEFLPKSLLDDKGNVMVDQYLKVKGAEDIWAAGDITDCQPAQYIYCEKQAGALARNLDLVLSGKEPVVYKTDGAPIMGVSLGRSRATGRFGNMKMPSLVIWFVKGRTLGVQNMPGLVSGASA
ncbi:FAD/NAD(P)-binding domain-containing protein [Mollisia scopiformis]|uniref:FAD/NAD(P)-binding domain-containing protein n=1 Tax=Mollisia scopiformis TaxID=149040 RepID=A0A194X9K4_MOLSC|nr:FAD/NAD(P)-binding domain-containing protein [Mollisia scopiformis]KUJ16809.1 FAD/NAD(P)-binding domain-containing protein [Mollisia scopiformis]